MRHTRDVRASSFENFSARCHGAADLAPLLPMKKSYIYQKCRSRRRETCRFRQEARFFFTPTANTALKQQRRTSQL